MKEKILETAPTQSLWRVRLGKLLKPTSIVLILTKFAALLFFQFQMLQEIEKLVAQQFLVIETINSKVEILQQKRQDSERRSPSRYRLKDSPHTQHIQRIESSAKMTLRSVCEHILRDEGKRAEPYADNIGVAIGVGRNLTTYGISTNELRAINPGFNLNAHLEKISIGDKGIFIEDIDTAKSILDTPLDDHDIALLLLSNLKNTAEEAYQVFGETWRELDDPRKEGIIDMLFNLGLPNFLQFKDFISAIKAKDFEAAGNAVLLSLAARENPARYQRVAKVIQTGDRSHFDA